jgi:excisionase family DNA binding protein
MRGLLIEFRDQMVRMLAARLVGSVDGSEFDTIEVLPLEDAGCSVAEAAETLGIGAEQTRRLLRAGILGGVQLGGRRGWLVSKASVDRLRRERSLGAPQDPPAATESTTAVSEIEVHPRPRKAASGGVLV